MPPYAPLFLAKRLLNSSRHSIRKERQVNQPTLVDGMRLGKSHTLRVVTGERLSCERRGQTVLLHVPHDVALDSQRVTDVLTPKVIDALRREAKSYLPRRLAHLAEAHGFSYNTVRFSHAGTRWGSCSSNGTISLNIALMKLEFTLIDYVLLHELSHTRHMNHSKSFWDEVERCDPEYKNHRRLLKRQQPTVF